jgi:phosphoribosylformylglycinamidine synthase
MEAEIYRFIIKSRFTDDPRSFSLLSDTRSLGLDRVKNINCQDIFYLAGDLSDADVALLGARLLSDPLTQEFEITKIIGQNILEDNTQPGEFIVEVALHPGVTDPVAEQIVRASHVLGVHGVAHAATGQRYVLQGERLDEEYVHLIACRLLSNPTIQSYAIGFQMPVFPALASSSGNVEIIPIQGITQEELLHLSVDRRAALDLQEMLAIQSYFQKENRDITDLEFETIAQTWSEHCVHKTFRAFISVQNPQDGDPRGRRNEKTINNLLKNYLRSATDIIHPQWLRSAFVDNAGIIEFDEEFEVSFKVETHNHPSAIEPFGGANTGVGGVIRDVIGVSAKPIAATDVLCFGPPDTKLEDLPAGVLHPRKIRSGVISGVQDYGNKIGIPTVSGAILYDPGFTANPLVFCGCVGIAPKDSHPRDPLPGDRVIVLGGKTGRDGLRGATFSSMTMDAQTGQVAGASVQIGAPIVEKGLIDVIMIARDERLYHAITDCGAGGLSSAVGEMASTLGADVDLAKVRLKYSGLAPWEIWLSEAQERMVLANILPRLHPVQFVFQNPVLWLKERRRVFLSA